MVIALNPPPPKDLIVSKKLRERFRKPYRQVFSSINKINSSLLRSPLITVGDAVSYNAINAGLKPDIMVYDGKEKRKAIGRQMRTILEIYDAEKIEVKNPAGRITYDLWQAVKSCFPVGKKVKKVKIAVDGEEDLAVLPIILEAPSGMVLYGMPDEGVVAVEISGNIKRKCKRLLRDIKKYQAAEGLTAAEGI